ncbi:MAG: thiol reductase thioredoxin [Flavobacteriaceae bacterium]|nr:MAG: thiol reductase thioredoxin [Flavobacteriaceae bacterium]
MFICCLILFLGCKEPKEEILIGKTTELELRQAPFSSWYLPNYEHYKIDGEEIMIIKPLLNDVEIKIFMGSWCSDSKREIPKFFKIMDRLDYSLKNIELISMDREKTTPENYEDGLNITNVPTFIFYKNGEELNRVVEHPIASLEKDMIKILTSKEYKHAYSE